MRSDIDVGTWTAASEHPLQRLECLRAVAMAGLGAAEALKACSRGVHEALEEICWRQLALSILAGQGCDEDPVGRYVAGSWMATCLELLSGLDMGCRRCVCGGLRANGC